MTAPLPYFYQRYLAAKKTVDDRALNREIWVELARRVFPHQTEGPLRVLEAGCGIGVMLERLIETGVLVNGIYTGIDFDKDNIAEAKARMERFAEARKSGFTWKGEGFLIKDKELEVHGEFAAVDLFDFIPQEQGRRAWDLLLAHAFLDLVPIPAAVPKMLSLLQKGGTFYFTLNFDGATIFQPSLELDNQVEALYHGTMDARRVDGQPTGGSRTGRRLFGHLQAAGATILAAGPSDWVVFPGKDGYPEDEAHFLHFLIDTIHRALLGHPDLNPDRFREWVAERRRQVERRELIFIAHQLDFVGYI
jgi:SAM-dependent methyltransferase